MPMDEFDSALGRALYSEFEEAKNDRLYIEEEWIKDLRQYKGIYDPEVLANIHPKRSKAFIRMTRTKVRSADARVMDMLFPGNEEKNWNIEPTPKPELPPKEAEFLKNAIARDKLTVAIQIATEQGDAESLDQLEEAVAAKIIPGPFQATPEEVEKQTMEVAKERAAHMSKAIEDQLTEADYPILMRDVIHHGNLLGTGVLKGPLIETRIERRWQVDQDGNWGLQEKEVDKPFVEQVPCWDIYPDQTVSELKQTEYVWQRYVMSRPELMKLKRRGFRGEVIDEYVGEHREGDTRTYTSFEQDLRDISKDKQFKSSDKRNKFEVLERWGYISRDDLIANGVKIPEEVTDMDFEANVWILGGYIIKLNLNPFDSQARPYHFYYFEKDETSIWGTSVPSIMRDPQKMFNAGIRIMLDNSAIAAGPQIEVNIELLEDDEDPKDVYPFRVWLRGGKGIDAQYPAVRITNLNAHIAELITMVNMFKQLGDEATSLPSYTHGEQDKGISRTVGGMSMLMGAANIVIKDVIRNVDYGVTSPFIKSMYHWNMQFNPDPGVKGDFDVKATGSSVLIAKEIQAQSLDDFANTTKDPIDDPWIKRGELLRKRARARDLPADDIVRTDQEYMEWVTPQQPESEGEAA